VVVVLVTVDQDWLVAADSVVHSERVQATRRGAK